MIGKDLALSARIVVRRRKCVLTHTVPEHGLDWDIDYGLGSVPDTRVIRLHSYDVTDFLFFTFNRKTDTKCHSALHLYSKSPGSSV
jgi:hypothetical protein